ncbi:hypothetical protein EB118_12600 [bacterium]|nr:hypothetical protein [bacterium]NDD83066.1 hypothetical protein [bacterium]NDG30899.1 hypothetical protein [bacterium]
MRILVILLVLICLIYILTKYNFNESITVVSQKDNNAYLIRRGKSKSEKYLSNSADTLAEINIQIEKLIEHLLKKIPEGSENRHYVKHLRKNYNHTVLSEAAIDQRYTTYTIDKKSMHVCLRTRDNNEQLYDINVLMYVILHELAHLCNYDIHGNAIQGHGDSFKKIFKLLVQESINIGVYKYIDYTSKPQEYCGMYISSSIV